MMLDFLAIVTKVLRKFQQNDIVLMEVPIIIDDCIDALSDLLQQCGDYRKKFNAMFNAHENTFGTLQLSSRRSTRGGIHANTVTTVDLDDDAEKFVKGALSYLKMRFGCFKNPPLSHFAALNFKKWPYDETERKSFGHDDISGLVKAFELALKNASCNVESVRSEWGKLKRRVVSLRTSPILSVYTDLLKGEFSNPDGDLSNILHLVHIMLTMSPSTAECERQFSGMKIIKANRRCCLQQDTLNDLMRVHCDGPEFQKFDPDPAINAWILGSTGWRHVHGHRLPRKKTNVKSSGGSDGSDSS
ncbi:zinc finger protein 862-like [Corticium candelabrum]|uniref:zinc finger protein 862-like n=1 Tax=Corticium candelabrum TaxID=121492 RepID=UPI002E2735ED|nr:zinc finger protein 862-like [Corticium candelabrum]